MLVHAPLPPRLQRGLAFVVAPYEADAQLAFLYREGIVDAVITEDSDLLPYGARRVFYKLDRASATGQEVRSSIARPLLRHAATTRPIARPPRRSCSIISPAMQTRPSCTGRMTCSCPSACSQAATTL